MKRSLFQLLLACASVLSVANVSLAQAPAAPPSPRVEFTKLVAHWIGYQDPAYLEFLAEAQPDIAQVGFYGAHFYSLAPTAHGAGYPAHFPVRGLKECGDFFEKLNAEVHRRGVKVVGHINVKFLVGDPESAEGPRGFFKFYKDLWDEKELGPKPVADAKDLLEKHADGTPISISNYSIGGMKEYWGCLNNPHWRTVLKAWTKRGIERGVDGYVINYFYRHNCLCEHCRREFHEYMKNRFTPEQLKEQFQIADLNTHVFTEIASWHDPKESTPLRREMLRFSQVANKRAFDEVFIEYGRKLKPGLIVAQWDHLGDFSQINGDERCMLPADLWGKGEDYLWYSTGAAAFFTDLPEGILGEGTLQARYIRGAFDDKPFTLGKYESSRTRVSIAELAANGGAPMGFYTNFADPLARKEIARYFQFMRRYDDLFRANRSHAEVLLLFPRSLVHKGDLTGMEEFKKAGKQLLDGHVLFDVIPDDMVTDEVRGRYKHVLGAPYNSSPLLPEGLALSRFDAPQTVRVSVNRPAKGDELDVHFVNYNRTEPMQKRSAGTGIVDEKPLEASAVKADLALPAGYRATVVQAVTPESPEPVPVTVEAAAGRVKFTVPPFLVYSVVRVQLEKLP